MKIGLWRSALTRPRDCREIIALLFTRIILLLLYLWLSDVVEQWRTYIRDEHVDDPQLYTSAAQSPRCERAQRFNVTLLEPVTEYIIIQRTVLAVTYSKEE